MIESLTIENFKAFSCQNILLRPLTLFTGLNGMGKSSALQSLLLLRQSYRPQALASLEGSGLVLNGELVQLGTGYDVLFDHAAQDEIGFSLKLSGQEARWRFAYDHQADVLRYMSESCVPHSIYASNLFASNFHYLEAERVGPRTSLRWQILLSVNRSRWGLKANLLFTSSIIMAVGPCRKNFTIPLGGHPR